MLIGPNVALGHQSLLIFSAPERTNVRYGSDSDFSRHGTELTRIANLQQFSALRRTDEKNAQRQSRAPLTRSTTKLRERFAGSLRLPPRDEAKPVLPSSIRCCASDPEAPTNCFPRRAIRPRPDEFGIFGFEPAQPF